MGQRTFIPGKSATKRGKGKQTAGQAAAAERKAANRKDRPDFLERVAASRAADLVAQQGTVMFNSASGSFHGLSGPQLETVERRYYGRRL